jgi:hypothetical protein
MNTCIIYTPLQICILSENKLASIDDSYFFMARTKAAVDQYLMLADRYGLVKWTILGARINVVSYALLACKAISARRLLIGNYNSRLAKLLSYIFKNKSEFMDDGTNTALIPMRKCRYITTFYTYFERLDLSIIPKVLIINNIIPKRCMEERNNSKSPATFIAGSADVEEGIVSIETYLNHLIKIHQYFPPSQKALYCAHRREGKEKIEKISKIFDIIYPDEPLEIFVSRFNVSEIVSFASTLEVTIPKIYDNINIISVRYAASDIIAYKDEYKAICEAIDGESKI